MKHPVEVMEKPTELAESSIKVLKETHEAEMA